MMPEMDGIECVSKIRQIGTKYAKNVPIIALTANAVIGMEQVFLKAGFSGFISKPISTIKLDEIIHKFICTDKQETSKTGFVKIAQVKKLPEIYGIDLEKGLENFSGNLEIYLRILNSFVTNIPNKLLTIIQPDEANLADYAITIHGIKGSCYGINANLVGDKAFELEKLAKANDIAEVKRLTLPFLKIIYKLLADLKAFVEQENSTKPAKPKNNKPNIELLQQILLAAQDYDNEEMQKNITELDKFDYETGGDLILQLKKDIDTFDYDATIEAIEKYLEQ